MSAARSNLVLIGMPGAGKSTVGVVLAKQTQRNFIDTDLLIQTSQNRPLQQIVNEQGLSEFLKIEETVLLNLSVTAHVVATGGSAVYSPVAMEHLRSTGPLIFLQVSLTILESRLGNFDSRGIARQPGQSLNDLFEQRQLLYEKFADLTIDCDQLSVEEICAKIQQQL